MSAVEIERTVKFKLSNMDDYVEVNLQYYTVVMEIAGEVVNLSTSTRDIQQDYLMALSDLLAKAAGALDE
jgi:hypothetical protein